MTYYASNVLRESVYKDQLRSSELVPSTALEKPVISGEFLLFPQRNIIGEFFSSFSMFRVPTVLVGWHAAFEVLFPNYLDLGNSESETYMQEALDPISSFGTTVLYERQDDKTYPAGDYIFNMYPSAAVYDMWSGRAFIHIPPDPEQYWIDTEEIPFTWSLSGQNSQYEPIQVSPLLDEAGIHEFYIDGYGNLVAHVDSNSTTFRAGLSESSGGPFNRQAIALDVTSGTKFYLRGGSQLSTGAVNVIEPDTGHINTAYFKVNPVNFTMNDPLYWEIYDHVSSFFDLFEDRDLLLRYWNAWQLMGADADGIIDDTDRDDFIFEMRAFHRRRHIMVPVDYRTIAYDAAAEYPYTVRLDFNAVSIPKMFTEIIRDQKVVLTQGVDYLVEKALVRFKKCPSRDGEILYFYCPIVSVDDDRPRVNFGTILDVEDDASEIYLTALRALWYAFFNGPSIENIQNALSAVCGFRMNEKADVVSDVIGRKLIFESGLEVSVPDGKVISIEKGDGVTGSTIIFGDKVYSQFSSYATDVLIRITASRIILSSGRIIDIPFWVEPGVQKGQSVEAFDTLFDGIRAYDRTFGRYLDRVDTQNIVRCFNGESTYASIYNRFRLELISNGFSEAEAGAASRRMADEFVKGLLQWHVHIIEVDVNSVLSMEKFYSTAFGQIIQHFRPKQDYFYIIMNLSTPENIYVTDEGLALYLAKIAYTVDANPADFFDYTESKDDYCSYPEGFAGAHIDALNFCIYDKFGAAVSTPDGSGGYGVVVYGDSGVL